MCADASWFINIALVKTRDYKVLHKDKMKKKKKLNKINDTFI